MPEAPSSRLISWLTQTVNWSFASFSASSALAHAPATASRSAAAAERNPRTTAAQYAAAAAPQARRTRQTAAGGGKVHLSRDSENREGHWCQDDHARTSRVNV